MELAVRSVIISLTFHFVPNTVTGSNEFTFKPMEASIPRRIKRARIANRSEMLIKEKVGAGARLIIPLGRRIPGSLLPVSSSRSIAIGNDNKGWKDAGAKRSETRLKVAVYLAEERRLLPWMQR